MDLIRKTSTTFAKNHRLLLRSQVGMMGRQRESNSGSYVSIMRLTCHFGRKGKLNPSDVRHALVLWTSGTWCGGQVSVRLSQHKVG